MADEAPDKGETSFPRRFTVVLILALSLPECFGPIYRLTYSRINNGWVDLLFRRRGMEKGDSRVNVVAIDDHSVDCVGQYPWPRSVYSDLLDGLYAAGVQQVGFDIHFLDPSRPEEDAALIRATRKAQGRLVHAVAVDTTRLDAQVMAYPFKKLRAAIQPAGFGSVVTPLLDTDGIIRREPLFIGEENGAEDRWVNDPHRLPVLGLAVLSRFEDKPPEDYLRITGGNVIRLNIRGEEDRPQGYSVVRGVQEAVTKSFPGINRIPAWKLLQPYLRARGAKLACRDELSEQERSALDGSMVLVGSTALGAYDHYPTPFSSDAPGVEIHANLIDNLLNNRFLRDTPWWVTVLLVVALGAASYFLMFLGPLQAALCAIALMALWVFATYFAFIHLYVLEFAAPAFSLAGTFVVLMVHKTMTEQRGKKEIQQMFGQYVAPEVVDLLVKDRSKLRLGGDKRDMTVFFLDIAHFTTISEKMAPEKLIQFLNHYLTALSDIILKNKGVVDKYIGDCIMAFWNAPIDVPKHRELACLSAVECIEAIKRLNQEYVDPTMPEKPAVRIGLNSGEVVVGNTGSARKLAYTVLGDEVNLASRLEGANKFFGSTVMASENTFKQAQDAVEGRVLGQVRVVGKAIPIRVFELLGKKGLLAREWQEALPHYNRGVEIYLERRFEEAKAEFEKVLKLVPEDKPTKLYLSVCDDYSVIPPPPEWDGVFNLTAK